MSDIDIFIHEYAAECIVDLKIPDQNLASFTEAALVEKLTKEINAHFTDPTRPGSLSAQATIVLDRWEDYNNKRKRRPLVTRLIELAAQITNRTDLELMTSSYTADSIEIKARDKFDSLYYLLTIRPAQ